MLWRLHAHRVLTTDQLAALEFDSLRRAQHRLAQLHQLGVLWRFRFPVLGGGSMPWHYTLGYDGARLIAAARAEDPPHKARYQVRLERLAQSPTLAHLLGVNDFFATLAWSARAQGLRPAHQPGGEGLVFWRSEAEVAAAYARGYPRPGSWIRPDGFGFWVQHGQGLGFFLEYDRGTETIRRVADKLADYNGPSNTVAEQLDGMLLFWLPTGRREHAVRTALATGHSIVPIATAAADLAGPHGPTGAAWAPLNLDGHRPPAARPARRLRIGELAAAIGGTTPDGIPNVLAVANARGDAEREHRHAGY